MKTTYRFAIASALLFAACHHEKAAVTTTPEPKPEQTATAEVKQPEQQPQPVSTNVSAGDDLVAKCKLHFDNQVEAPKFDFDHFELTTDDRDVLGQIATCVTTGPLAGKKLALIGRADPRGTAEYNMGLGDRRANQVGSYLERLGVKAQQVASTTRGAIDATGTDESGWRTDRRVDVQLSN
jgi:peptidoglycan-associated lipoprotein